jgi:pimeloyl-ACP methyl ester carboxylesterase
LTADRAQNGYVDLDFGQIHYSAYGQMGPRLALLHESPLSNKVFEKALPILGEWARVFAPDTPGYGNSTPLPRESSLSNLASVLAEAISTWAAGEKVIICGVHTGASLAIEIAAKFPDLCSGLFLIGVPVYSDAQRIDRIANWCPDISIDESGKHLIWAWERYQQIWPTAPVGDRNLAVLEMLRVWERYNWGYLQAFAYRPDIVISSITCPIHIAAAEGEYLYSASEELAKKRNIPFTTFLGIDGQVPLRNPESFSKHLELFSESL